MLPRAIIVEDSAAITETISDLLSTIGIRVTATFSEEMDATAWVLENPQAWDVAVLDLVLREGSGFNLIHRCRQANPRGLIVIVSNYAAPGVVDTCKRAGADAVFPKFEGGALADYLESMLPRN